MNPLLEEERGELILFNSQIGGAGGVEDSRLARFAKKVEVEMEGVKEVRCGWLFLFLEGWRWLIIFFCWVCLIGWLG